MGRICIGGGEDKGNLKKVKWHKQKWRHGKAWDVLMPNVCTVLIDYWVLFGGQ